MVAGGSSAWWRNMLATIIAQGLDTCLFINLAFRGTEQFPTTDALWAFAFSVWAVKVAVAIIDTPYIYLSYTVQGLRVGGTNK